MIELAEDGFYEDIIFHRVLNDFVIQGGDPAGTGSGGSTLGDFDDQFDPDLQHNRTGLLSMAKSTDDTNDSQFFVTEGENTMSLRNLDFNHTVFGVLVEGESNRAAISDTAVTGPANSPRPVNDVVMEGIDIFEDQENAVLRLTAADGATGSANITVTVADQDGNMTQRTFTVTLAADTFNGRPYLLDVPDTTADRNTIAEVQLESVDVEGDAVFYTAQRVGTVDYDVTVSASGLVQVTPPVDFVGSVEVFVGVGRTANVPDDTQRIIVEFV
jgi:cyclophilin family peptidyl-prolyl cis-trans isomerase